MNNPTQLTDISYQLAHVADELRQVAKKLEKSSQEAHRENTTENQPPRQDENLDNNQLSEMDLLSDIPHVFDQEAENILQNVIDQIAGSRLDTCNPDQLYGWADSLQKVLGTTTSAPTSEVRKLQDLIDQLIYQLN